VDKDQTLGSPGIKSSS